MRESAIKRLVVGLVVMAMGPAAAAGDLAECTFSGGVLTVNILADNVPVTVVRDGSNIEVRVPGGQVMCMGGTPTVTNTDTIDVTDNTISNQVRLIISMAGGRFEPGAEAETSIPEIEFDIFFPEGSLAQRLTIIGTASRDEIDLGGFGAGGDRADLNDDADNRDLDLGNVDLYTIRAEGGRDEIDADEVPPFDIPLPSPLVVRGGPGNDIVRGGQGVLTTSMQGGADQVLGGPARDRLSGGPGQDVLKGRGRNDVLGGAGGNDRLSGGPGRDTCVGGPGDDRLFSCER